MLEAYPDVLTVKEAAKILRISERMVYLCIEEGAIKAFRLKTASGRPMRRWFIPKHHLVNYLEGTET